MTTTCALITALSAIMAVDISSSTDQPGRARPNIVVILADDLGFSDLACYGGEIRTPHLDGLAAGGLRFTQFYNTARCWPSRAAILTGYYAQQVRRDTVPGVKSGGAGTRPKWAKLLPERLRPLGYRSYHSGKWHVDGMPTANGFDRSYYLEDAGRHFSPRVHYEDDRKLPPVEPGTGYYTTTAIAEHAVKYLGEHAAKHKAQPFFLYLAFTSPHFPLQARPEDIERYRDRYREGWEAVREDRWKRIRELGLVRGALSDVERDIGPPYPFPNALKALGPAEVNRPVPWTTLTDEQRAFQATKMAIHAAMVDRMDRRSAGCSIGSARWAPSKTLSSSSCPTTAPARRSWSATTATTRRRRWVRHGRTSASGRAGPPCPIRRFDATRPGSTREESRLR